MENDVAQFKRISIPLVRRIYPSLIANKLVSVQPLVGPASLVYYLRHQYSKNKGNIADTWVIKKKKKVIWRSITDTFEPQNPSECL